MISRSVFQNYYLFAQFRIEKLKLCFPAFIRQCSLLIITYRNFAKKSNFHGKKGSCVWRNDKSRKTIRRWKSLLLNILICNFKRICLSKSRQIFPGIYDWKNIHVYLLYTKYNMYVLSIFVTELGWICPKIWNIYNRCSKHILPGNNYFFNTKYLKRTKGSEMPG